MNCKHCDKELTKNQKFCSRSCAASFNNKGVRRNGKAIGTCSVCGILKKSNERNFCSRKCFGISRRKDKKHKLSRTAQAQSKYRAKRLRVLDPLANKEKIKLIYKNCPEGYEVDHIIPLSRGGKHHEDNLQYLTKKQNRKKGSRVVGDPGYDPSHYAVMSSRPSHLAHPPLSLTRPNS